MRVLGEGDCRYRLVLGDRFIEVTTNDSSEKAKLEELAKIAERVVIERGKGVLPNVERDVERGVDSQVLPQSIQTRPQFIQTRPQSIQTQQQILKDAVNENVHETNKFGLNRLQLSALNGKYDSLKWCIRRGIGREGIDKTLRDTRDTSLTLACQRTQLASNKGERAACVGLLLLAGADPTKQNADGDTALHLAIRYRSPDIIKIFVNLPLDLRSYLFSIKNNEGKSPLDEIKAAFLHVSVKEALFKVAAKSLPSPSHVAVDLDKLREIIPSDIPKLEFGSAIEAAHREPRMKLRKKGVIPESIFEVPIGEYLFSLARRGDIDALNRHSKYLHHVDPDGRNVFMGACLMRNKTCLVWLIENYTEKTGKPLLDALNLRDDYGCTPALFAAAEGNLDTQGESDCLELLMDNGANVNVADNKGFTPLHLAAQNLYPKIVKQLLTDPDCKVDVLQDGQSPLRLASRNLTSEADKAKFLEIEKLLNPKAVTPSIHVASKIVMGTGETEKTSKIGQKAIDSLNDFRRMLLARSSVLDPLEKRAGFSYVIFSSR